jgi:hypothetical protein
LSTTQCPAGLWPPPRTAISRSCSWAKAAVATSPALHTRDAEGGGRAG